MVKSSATYTGELHCVLVHEPSKSQIETDAPKDNQGRGEKFSPTDLVGAALLSCILTTMGIVARRDNVSMDSAKGSVEKEMNDHPRRIKRLKVELELPASWSQEYRGKMERVAHQCPVHKSLSSETQIEIIFNYK